MRKEGREEEARAAEAAGQAAPGRQQMQLLRRLPSHGAACFRPCPQEGPSSAPHFFLPLPLPLAPPAGALRLVPPTAGQRGEGLRLAKAGIRIHLALFAHWTTLPSRAGCVLFDNSAPPSIPPPCGCGLVTIAGAG